MLDADLKTQLKAYLEKVTQPIELVASLDDGDKSRELRRAARRTSPRCRTRSAYARRDDDARKPSFAINRAGTDVGVRFAGIPMGHEFTSLVLALLQVGGHPSKVDAGADRADRATSTASYALRDLFLAARARTARTWCRR